MSRRDISSSSHARKEGWKTWEIDDNDLPQLKVNQTRLMAELHHTCQWGSGVPWKDATDPSTQTGMSRLALSDADKAARDWFVETTRSLGCDVTVDAMGNIFAVRPGSYGPKGIPTYCGSHLDTQPAGGRYDGILGVLAGVEMLRVMKEHDVETAYPVGVVNWTNEEGARFPISMVSSGVWAGEIPLERAHALKEVGGSGATMRDELERIGYLGTVPASYEAMPMAAHFELHIEQGPILEAENRRIGIVEGVQAYRWYTVEVVGREAHTGTTPFSARADALLTAARMIAYSHEIAVRKYALASTGILSLSPGSVNTVPGKVTFSLDIRAPFDKTLDDIERTLFQFDFRQIVSSEYTKGRELSFTWTVDSVSPATRFQKSCIEVAKSAAESLGKESSRNVRVMTSGAGHDSVYTSRRCPTSMIFVRCRDGVSHNPEEYASPEDCATGAEVLLQSVLRYDRLRYFKDNKSSDKPIR
ncbi:hypothetical protein B0H66DRAFT_475021 [Apodospora peruviana]|uniref:Peptidase M20 dimerisation domain-containing protein n=1 Tax=Apodospora peruviana TaxID=516989 RepID=A0AAE0M9E8_9PEZI|nr:hypothetical protein B0H66DRAFT_475021 [Apodospora peruviana]